MGSESPRPEAEHLEYDAIVVGAGVAGAVCAGILTARGASVLVVAHPAGERESNFSLGGSLQGEDAVYHPSLLPGPDEGHWAKVVAELNLPVRALVAPPIAISRRGERRPTRLPVMLSSSDLCDLLVRLTAVPLETVDTHALESVLKWGLQIPQDHLRKLHNTRLEDCFDELRVDVGTRHLVEQLIAVGACVPTTSVAQHFSVFGAFSQIRAMLAPHSPSIVIAPDVRRGFTDPLLRYIETGGGTVWRRGEIASVVLDDDSAVGVQMTDGRVAMTANIAMAIDSGSIASLFATPPVEVLDVPSQLPDGVIPPKVIVTTLTRPVAQLTDRLIIHDAATGANMWLCPVGTPVGSGTVGDYSQVIQCSGDVDNRGDGLIAYLDDVCEDEFPGWKAAVGSRKDVSGRSGWLAGCLARPRLSRVSPTIRNLWYVGEGTTPIEGFATEQATSAGYQAAEAIAEALIESDAVAGRYER